MLVLFAKFLLKNGLVLKNQCPSLQLCITTSEMLTEDDRKIMMSGFGDKIINEYGISEAGGITAFEDASLNWRLSFETQFIEIVDDKGKVLSDGERGEF